MPAGQKVKPKVLIVDDDPHVCLALGRILRRDHEVFLAESAEAALTVLEREQDVAVVVSDFRMPDMNGVELLVECRRRAPSTVRILTSGHAELSELRDLVDACELYTFISKPFEHDAVKLIAQRAVEHHRLIRDNDAMVEQLSQQAAKEATVRRAFQQYVPSEVVDELVQPGGPSTLPGRKRDITLLLVDLRDFTSFSEKREPAFVVGVLNRFFSTMAAPLMKYGGTIDKYIGDAVLAHFGSLRDDEQAAQHAVRAALEMREAMVGFNASVQAAGHEAFRFGVAINSGACIVGNVGCAARMDYTVIGDPVNVVARLQEITKRRPDAILVSGSTFRRLNDEFKADKWHDERPRGRAGPVEVFEILGVA